MSNTAGNHFDNQLILYFLLITTVLYVSVYLVLNHFGYTFADVPSNGNVITPIIESIFDLVSTFLTWLTSFSLFGVTPFGFLSGVTSALVELINQIVLFVNVWNILNIYVFYIIFIPFTLITCLIITDLVIRLIEGLIP